MLETPGRIEPCFFEEHIPATLADLSIDIQREATLLGQGLHPDSAAELEEETRPLALEARAQVIVQREIDEMPDDVLKRPRVQHMGRSGLNDAGLAGGSNPEKDGAS